VADYRHPGQVDRDPLLLERLEAAAHVIQERLLPRRFAAGRALLVERKEDNRAALDQMLDPSEIRIGIAGP
jgi:hypothetical protein